MYISRFKKKFDRYCSEEFKFPKEYTKIELGVGNSKVFKDTLGIDINPNSDADEISDIFDYLDKQKDSSISFIYSSHVIEHLNSVEEFLKKCDRVLVDKGLIYICAPHFSNPYYYSDPTHINFFGLYTMSYFCKSNFIRKLPKYFNMSLKLNLIKTKLNFKVPIHLAFLYPIFLFLKFIFNSSKFMQELYEFIFVKFIPCYEIVYLIRKE